MADAGKRVLDGIEAFDGFVGETVGPSQEIVVTKEAIQELCRATGNEEWIHWDEERCREAGFGTLLAPGFFALSHFSRLFFDMVEIRNVPKMMMLGTDKIRLLAPLKAGDRFTMSVTATSVEPKNSGIAVHYNATWSVPERPDKPFCVADVIIRYMP